MKYLLLFCFITFGFFNIFAQERFVKPVDEAKRDAAFFTFRSKLVEAVKNRDSKYILSIVDPKIRNTFGDDNGITYFKRIWKLDSKNSKFWNEFSTVISNGGTFYKEADTKTKQFCAPYLFTVFPEDLDAFDYSAIFGKNVILRSKPSVKSSVVANLSYNVVKVDFDNSVKSKADLDAYEWLKIETLGGKKGFVNPKFVRSSVDYRACFEKIKGNWKMTAFVAGD